MAGAAFGAYGGSPTGGDADPRDPMDSLLLSVGVKDAESGGKKRQIRRPFHLHVQFLRRFGGCYAEIEWIWCLNVVMHDRDMMGGAHFIHGCHGG